MIHKNLPHLIAFIVASLASAIALGQVSVDPDPNGVLIKPIPDKLIVLTFDDAPASHATVVAPILKSLGFGGTFYVCNFDSFKTRKDWYLTYRQMVAMNADGFEIGNHTHGHGGGLANYLRMEDEVIANHGPKMTTACWPVYQVAWSICPDLAARGYTFGRGGHERPYRPTVDNPFDVPSFTIKDGPPIENFVKQAQMACKGRVVVFCFHGVPDMEHPGVSLEPASFKAMMQYLKDNNYQCIAMRDMAKYIDPAKAAKLPRTANSAKDAPPFDRVKDDKPFVAPPACDIREFSFPGLPPASISKTSILLTVAYGTDVKALSPHIKVSPDATIAPANGTVRDFSKPQTYTVTARDGSTKSYLVTVKTRAASDAKEMLTFEMAATPGITISRDQVTAYLPSYSSLKELAPKFTLSPFATAVPSSGTFLDFTRPQRYRITAQDGSSRTVTVSVVHKDKQNVFVWKRAEDGNWSDATKWWASEGAMVSSPDNIIDFTQAGECAVKNDLNAGFLLNQLVLGDRSGRLTVNGNGLTFAKEPASQILPSIRATKCQRVDINLPLTLQDDFTVNTFPGKDPNCFISFNEVISGPGSLILHSSGDPNVAGTNFHDVHFGILQLNNSNTYTGGTVINGGKINVRKTNGLGTGTITLSSFGTLSTEANLANPVVINQGTLFHSTLSGPVTLNGTANLIGKCTISGPISGPGGLTMLGTNGTYLSMIPGGTVSLAGANTYTGPTIVFPGTLIVKNAAGLYGADAARWTPGNISIQKAATLRLNVGGPGEFTGQQIGTLLDNLTRQINDNGLMGGSYVSLDTAGATGLVTLSADIADSKGPGGGAFVIRKCGAGTMRLSGNNSYTGQTILEGGALVVSSLNSVTKALRQASSSLGAPTDIEAGEIVIGEEGKDGDCGLIYTGPGESSDRVMNLAGKNTIVTFDQSGAGLLKLTSPILISGYGASKTIVLRGDTAGTGEIAGDLSDPHDRAGKAKTAVTKFGRGKWVLSGTNSHSGPTRVTQGTLSLASVRSLSHQSEVEISEGAVLELDFKGEVHVGKLSFGGIALPAGTYDAKNSPKFIKGSGVLKN
ncbi:autotransporter-associated beta strand repeat-containing protein [Humisphaera borealis]|uniref:Autotransporter-associated beta strand repeat-containing protein n=1 Tax=Humisphaera borealis TaxID=2807512 RepID=A0A7M2WWK5_9BACT|nr:autotransporter-associated beta strand repeat-containing protein [Humisphaera borealis]QOV89582.1 autotransporter-associated beta strand repeat-containing protein [Humisphaera borealis]